MRYTEQLSGLPSVTNYATADFEVLPAKPGSDFIIRSTHSTCFYTDWFCREYPNFKQGPNRGPWS